MFEKKIENLRFSLIHDPKVMCAAVSVIIFNKSEILLIKRAIRQGDPWSGHISFPGGRAEMGDSDNPYFTAIRETEEEIGVILKKRELIHNLSVMIPEKDFRGYKLELWPLLFLVENNKRKEINIDSLEVQEVIWMPLGKISGEFPVEKGIFKSLSGQKVEMPCLRLSDGNEIWGLTFLVLSELNRLINTKTIRF